MIQIIPAIDIIEGHCVRLSQGDYARQKTYESSPVDMVKRYVDCGMKRIHVVDLDGAKTSQPKNLRILEQMAGIRGVEIEWGGGLKSDTALRDLFNAGATYAIVGSLAAKNPECFSAWLNIYGPEHIILGADVREGKVSVSCNVVCHKLFALIFRVMVCWKVRHSIFIQVYREDSQMWILRFLEVFLLLPI